MAYPKECRIAVRKTYVEGRVPLTQAAAMHQVGYETARRWKALARAKGDCWDNARVADRISNGGLGDLTAAVLDDFIRLFQTTLKDLRTHNGAPIERAEAISRLSDAYAKTVKAAGATSPDLAKLAIALDVTKQLAEYIRNNHPQHTEVFLEILEPFGEHLSKVYG
jgi:hypothetical protein